MTVLVEGRPATVASLRGELDIATVDDATEYALRCTVPGTLLVLDLSEMTFCDCSGLTALLRIVKGAQASGCRVVLSAPPPMLVKMLSITGLGDRLPVLARPVKPRADS